MEHSVLSGMFLPNLSPESSGTLKNRRQEDFKNQRIWRSPRKAGFLNIAGLTCILTETVAIYIDPA